jgi:hypothetical protein
MFVHFSVRQLLKHDFGVDLPLAGGIGNSVKDPVIIKSEAGPDYRQVEDEFIKYICLGRRVKWEFLQRDLLTEGQRRLEKVKIRTQEITQKEIITQIENYYFDITECIVPASERRKTHRDFPQLINELEARDTLFRREFDSDERRSIAPWIAPFGKGGIESKNDALWESLFEDRILEEEALEAMTDLMERYYGRKYPLDRQWTKK